MKTFKSTSKFGANMKSRNNNLNAKIEMLNSRATKRKLEREKLKKVINL